MAYRLVHDQSDGEGDGRPFSNDASDRRRRRRRRQVRLRKRVARKGIAVLPAMFTLSNLLCGCAAIFMASRPADMQLPFHWTPLTFAAIFIFAGMVCDGVDGRIARLTRNTSDLGEQLDSMADMVTFGVAPAFIAVQLVGVGAPFITVSNVGDHYFDRITIVIAGIYAACCALRLARFNIEASDAAEADHESFKGLPSPGAAGTVASLVLLHQHFLAHYPPTHWSLQVAAAGMVAVMLLTALAMVSEFRYIHVMNRYVRGPAPFETLARAVVLTLLLLVAPQGSLAAALVLYALSAPVSALYRRLSHRPSVIARRRDHRRRAQEPAYDRRRAG